MKIYFAGPLFTPYVRQFIAAKARVLRRAGIDPFVPHERFNQMITPQRVAQLAAQGVLPQSMAEHFDAEEVMDLVRAGKLSRELLGLPAMSPATIFDTDYEGLGSANAVLALLDGTQVDDGTACEVGILYGLMQHDPGYYKGIVGYITDSRGTRQRDSGYGQNMFVLGMIEAAGAIYDDFDAAVAHLLRWDSELRARS